MDKYHEILSTEYNYDFDRLREKAMVMSYYKYGPMKDNKGLIDDIESLKLRIKALEETKNTEYAVDIANFAMKIFTNPPEGYIYKPTDSDKSPGIVGMSINEIKEFNG